MADLEKKRNDKEGLGFFNMEGFRQMNAIDTMSLIKRIDTPWGTPDNENVGLKMMTSAKCGLLAGI